VVTENKSKSVTAHIGGIPKKIGEQFRGKGEKEHAQTQQASRVGVVRIAPKGMKKNGSTHAGLRGGMEKRTKAADKSSIQ